MYLGVQNNRVLRKASCKRAALTLVELLIVVGLLTLLATFSLSGMRDLMRSQKVSQASTLVKQYLQNAQIRAISNGRPVAVFLDRVSFFGDANAYPLPGNYTATRLQFGEVFPPYVGDIEDTFCQLVDSDGNGFADRIVFGTALGSLNERTKVLSGFGFFTGNSLTEGFLQKDDVIQVEGSSALFAIGDYKSVSETVGTGEIVVPFGNSMIASQFPVTTGTVQLRRFKVFRQPTKSLVASVILPRGTCVDLSLSGFGPFDCGAGGGEFYFQDAASASLALSPSNFSRIGIVFDAQGKLSYMMHETSFSSVPRRIEPISSSLYLMVGRTDQVLPGLVSASTLADVIPNQSQACFSDGTGELPQSNLLDQENVWITCNPFTGEIKSSPVSSFTLNQNPPANYVPLVDAMRQARSAAIAGLTN